MREAFGKEHVYLDTDTNRWRTQIWGGRCVFLKDNACSIHNSDMYPHMCRSFPWQDADNPLSPRAFDVISCTSVPLQD